MPQNWQPVVLIGSLALVIPLVIILGQRLRGGPTAVASGGALLGIAAVWLLLRTAYTPTGLNGWAVLLTIIGLAGGILLLVAGWTLALADAAQSQRWGWLAVLCFTMFLNVAAMYNTYGTAYATCFAQPAQPWQEMCASINPIAEALVILGWFVGPATSLVYALRLHAPQSHALPDDLSVSSLDAPHAESL